jgi:hypothetical protein
MTALILQQQIMQELQHIPEHKLAEIYDLIHYFRLGLSQTELTTERKPGLLKGQLGDAFFEPLPEDELKAWETDI